jgi:glycosidase
MTAAPSASSRKKPDFVRLLKFFVMQKTFLALIACLLFRPATAQVIYPTNWWTGMKHSTIQLLIRGEDVGKTTGITVNYPGVTLTDWHHAGNPHYLILHVNIGPEAKPGTIPITLNGAGSVGLPLKERRKGNGTEYAQGIRSSDFIYFLMPDRWSNGDINNDRVAGLKDQSLNRDSIFLRHGGDLQGILNHLDYLQQLGVTALWMTPVIENDMPDRTEHGYAFTDHYTIDPRLGGAEGYKKLSAALHQRGMKLIQDAVYNHVGGLHWITTDPPEKNWLHQWPQYTQTNYRGEPLMDPHASATDRKLSGDGWFTRQMPDLNQDDPDLAQFLIQHAIWSVEEFGVDGWRIDTYMYNSLPFMNRCNKALTDEYPKLTMFGEAWITGTAKQAYFARNNLNVPFKSNLTGVLDFNCLFNGISSAVKDTSTNGGGVNQLYQTLSDDFLYQDPTNNVIFLDNHDMTRFFSQTGEDAAALTIGIEWLLTARGIPQLYYGTEIMTAGIAHPDGLVRLDFPGGWPGDKRSAFTGEGLTAAEKSIQDLVKKLGQYRLHSTALRTGRMMQYLPQGSLYVYFRYDAKQTILCAMNTGNVPAPIDFGRFGERTKGFTRGINILTGEKRSLSQPAQLPGRTMWILELGQ